MSTFIVSRIIIPFFSVFVMISCSKDAGELVPLPYTEGTVQIAKWKGNKKAVLLIQFDDSTPGQATLGVPAMSKRALVGTWYVNPGGEYYLQHEDVWTTEAPAGNQELANHTMTHTGASTYDEVVYEVGEASKAIWQIRKEDNFVSLIAFNRGGGTSWNEDDLKKVLEEYKNIDRLSYTGVKMIAKTIPIGSNSDVMFELIPIAINDSIICSIHFHGISDDNDGDDNGNGAVWVKEFEIFLDRVVSIKDEVWNTGYISMYKYIIERNNSNVELVQYSNEKYGLTLKSTTQDKYYNEALTVLVYLPADWKSCKVMISDTEKVYPLNNGLLMIDVLPNIPEVIIDKYE